MRASILLLVITCACAHSHPQSHTHGPQAAELTPEQVHDAICAVAHDHQAWVELWEQRDAPPEYTFDEAGNWSAVLDGCNVTNGSALGGAMFTTAMYCPGPPQFCQNEADEWGSCRDHTYYKEPRWNWDSLVDVGE